MTDQMLIFGGPNRYIQGAGAITVLGDYVKNFGRNMLLVGSKTALEAICDKAAESMKRNGIDVSVILFGGETTDKEISRLVSIGNAIKCDAMIGVGGGKVIDAVKAAGEDMDIPVIIVPTIASNDAPCSALSVIYHEDGTFARLRSLKSSPALVLVDTEVISKAPVRQLVSGMGDALATWFEADSCYKARSLNNFGGRISMAAMALSKMCCDAIFEHGMNAKVSCEKQIVTPALEKVIEANILLSGLGFESGGVGIAHALSEAFNDLPEMHYRTHGEKVAFGLLVHLFVDNYQQTDIQKIGIFLKRIGLPVTFSELGIRFRNIATIRRISESAVAPGKPSHNMAFKVTADLVFEAAIAADQLGRNL